MVADAKASIRNLTPSELADGLRSTDTVVVDLREASELAEHGMIAGAVHAPRGMLEFYADPESPYHRPELDPQRRTVLCCASGGRSALACQTLRSLGDEDVAHLDGGVRAWQQDGRPLVDATRA